MKEKTGYFKDRYFDFVQTFPSAIISYNSEGRILLSNNRAARLFGYSNSVELEEENFFELIAPQDRHRFIEDIKKTLKKGIRKQKEFDFLKKDLTGFIGGISTSAVLNSKGESGSCFISVIADITERKKLQVLRQAELEILNYLAETDNLPWAIQMILLKILETTGFQAGSIRLIDGDSLTFLNHDELPEKSAYDNLFMDSLNIGGELVSNQGADSLKCIFSRFICEKVSSYLFFLNEYGSFFTGSSSLFIKEVEKKLEKVTDYWCTKCNDAGQETIALIPIKAGKDMMGIIQLHDQRDNRFNFEDLIFLESISQPIGYVVKHLQDQGKRIEAERQLKQSYKKMESLSKKVLNAYEEERARLARELHDEIGQALTTTKLDLQMLGEELTSLNPQLEKRLDYSIKLVNNALQIVRNRAVSLRPPALDDMGFVPAVCSMVKELGKRSGFWAEVNTKGKIVKTSKEVEIVLFRCIQEAITNVARHADASEVLVKIEYFLQKVSVKIKDNGKGFVLSRVKNQMENVGLTGMQERVDLSNGKISIKSKPGEGTEIFITIPLA